jgi:hypothetical protein
MDENSHITGASPEFLACKAAHDRWLAHCDIAGNIPCGTAEHEAVERVGEHLYPAYIVARTALLEKRDTSWQHVAELVKMIKFDCTILLDDDDDDDDDETATLLAFVTAVETAANSNTQEA